MKIRALAIVTALTLPALAIADNKTPTGGDKTTTGDKPMTGDKTTDTKAAKLGDSDLKIVAHLHHVNQMEIDLGKAAQKNGTAGVKTYGTMLVTDHQSADKDLTTFAKAHKLNTIPADKPDNDADKQAQKDMMTEVAHLKMLKGAAFDTAFLTMMSADHDKELAKIDVAMGAASDPDLKTILTSVKPVLQRHADQARDLQKTGQASASSTPTTPTSPTTPTAPSTPPTH